MTSSRILSGFVLLLGVVSSLADRPLVAQEKKDEKAIAVEDLTKEYANNPKEFDAKYKGKVVVIEGVVSGNHAKSITSKDVYLMMDGYQKAGAPVANSVRCVVTPDFANVRIGHKVRVQGTCQGHSETSFAAELRDCKLVRVLADDFPPKEPVLKELKQLEGKWQVASGELGGKKLTGKDTFFEEIQIERFQIELKAGDRVFQWGLAIDPAKTPKEMDFVRGEKDRVPLLYALEDGKLKVIMPKMTKDPKDMQRPGGFDTNKVNGLLLIAERQK